MNQDNNIPQPQSPSTAGVRGIILTITDEGRVSSQILGSINEAEFLGLGTYLTNILIKDGILALSRNQVATIESIREVVSKLENRDEKGREECGRESCSDLQPLQDSGLSLESSQEDSVK
jgi:hypothetical protein